MNKKLKGFRRDPHFDLVREIDAAWQGDDNFADTVDELREEFMSWPEKKMLAALYSLEWLLGILDKDPLPAGRKQGSKTKDPYHRALHDAAFSIREKRRANPSAAKKKGWTIQQIRSEIAARPLLQKNPNAEQAVRRALKAKGRRRVRF